MRCPLLLAAVALCFFAPSPARAAEGAKEEKPRNQLLAVVEWLRPSVVLVRATRAKPATKEKRTVSGLGVVIDARGVIVMPLRLAERGRTLEVELSDGRKFMPTAVLADARAGVAVITLPRTRPLLPARFGDSDKAKFGDFALSLHALFRKEIGIERGILSGKRPGATKGEERFLMDSCLATVPERDLLFDRGGKLIGVWTPAGAVPANRVCELVRRLLAERPTKSGRH